MKKWLTYSTGATLCLMAGGAQALEGITINGFLTAGLTYGDHRPIEKSTGPSGAATPSDAVTQDGNIANRVTFVNDSRFGLQVSAKINQEIDVTGQLLARAKDEDSNLKADWAFLTYHVSDSTALRMGKLKLTTFLVSDYIEVGFAYPWIRPPQEVYNANAITAFNGVDMLYKLNFGDSSFLFQPYFGQSKGASALVPQEMVGMMPGSYNPMTTSWGNAPLGTVMYSNFTVDHMYGLNTSFGNDIYTVRAGYLHALMGQSGFFTDQAGTFTTLGGTMDWNNIVLYGEYFLRKIDGMANVGFPNQKGYYTTFGYRIGKFLPHLTYSKIGDNKNPVGIIPSGEAGGNGMMMYGTPTVQDSYTLGLRYELGSGAALKFEAQQIKPKAGTRGMLIADPNGAYTQDRSESVMIYGLAVDLVF